MIDSRIQDNPSKNQNQQHYTLTSYRKGFDGRVCHYYLPFAIHNRCIIRNEFFVISKEPFEFPCFTGITIHNEKAKQIILSIDWNKWIWKGMIAYFLTYADFHRGYNENAK